MPSQQALKLDMRAQIRAYLAAETWVPWSVTGPDEGGTIDDPELTLSGKQFLLRQACPRKHLHRDHYGINQPRGRCIWCESDSYPSTQSCLNDPECHECCGLGYLFDDSPDALWDAVRAKGWSIDFEQWPSGDTVIILSMYERWESVGDGVIYEEGLRGQSAIELAVARALGWKGE